MDKKKIPMSMYIIIGLAIFLIILIICIYFTMNNNSTLKSKNDENINKIKSLNDQITDLTKKNEKYTKTVLNGTTKVKCYEQYTDDTKTPPTVVFNMPAYFGGDINIDCIIIVTYGNVTDVDNYMMSTDKGYYYPGNSAGVTNLLQTKAPNNKSLGVRGDMNGNINVLAYGMGDTEITVSWTVFSINKAIELLNQSS